MIKIKLGVLVPITSVLIIFGCNQNGKETQFNYMSENWKSGKALFYDKCSPCHTPRFKDEIFSDYQATLKGKSVSDMVVLLKSTLEDSNHQGENLDFATLKEEEIKNLQVYIQVQRPEVIE